MAWNYDFASWIRKKARIYTDSVVSIGGTLTAITRQPDGHLTITYTRTTGSSIVFDAGIIPDGETPELREDSGWVQYRFATVAPTAWTNLFKIPEQATFEHVQSVAAAVWTIPHNLGKQYVDVLIIDSTGKPCSADVDYVNVNVTVITFSIPVAGTAIIRR